MARFRTDGINECSAHPSRFGVDRLGRYLVFGHRLHKKTSVLRWSGGLGGGGFQAAVHTGLGAALRGFCGFRDLDSHVRRPFEALSVVVTVPVRLPFAVGLKVTQMMQFARAATPDPQLLLCLVVLMLA